MFDLPVDTSEDRRNYRKFRKKLISEGFFMMQYSIYVRVCVTRQAAQFLEKRIKVAVPEHGKVQTMMVTEKQYQEAHYLAGDPVDDVLNSSERTVVL